ncbi:mucin-2-like [Corticium candelabrum]|uniref:mucin-2-like n=1 Tax=Corticium candelabrum TaxID=121492 RepID=UPI002E2602D1|nr:mucin-2-like [Corticium candelabrum]
MQCANVLLSICLLCVRCNFVSSYSSGPPDAACTSMEPSHGVSGQTSASPYIVETDVPTDGYMPGSSYTVTIKKDSASTPDFKGFMCQIRAADGSSTAAIGSFESFDTNKAKNLACTSAKGAMTHKNADAVAQFQGTWKAPSSDMGSLIAMCTVVQVQTTYWIQIPSPVFSFVALSTTAAPTTADPTTAVPTTAASTTAASTTADPTTAAQTTAAPTTAASTTAAPTTADPTTAASTTAAPTTADPTTAASTTEATTAAPTTADPTTAASTTVAPTTAASTTAAPTTADPTTAASTTAAPTTAAPTTTASTTAAPTTAAPTTTASTTAAPTTAAPTTTASTTAAPTTAASTTAASTTAASTTAAPTTAASTTAAPTTAASTTAAPTTAASTTADPTTATSAANATAASTTSMPGATASTIVTEGSTDPPTKPPTREELTKQWMEHFDMWTRREKFANSKDPCEWSLDSSITDGKDEGARASSAPVIPTPTGSDCVESNAEMLTTVLLSCVLIGGVRAFPNGPPRDVCGSMAPSVQGHLAFPQTIGIPYRIETSATSGYLPGNTYTMTIKKISDASNDFRGFMCQARRDNSEDALGSFTSFDTSKAKNLDCTSATSAVVHRNSNEVSEFTAQWQAPSQTGLGTLRFVCTVVMIKTVYYVKLQSQPFSEISSTVAPPTARPTTKGPTTAAPTTAAPTTKKPTTAAPTTAAPTTAAPTTKKPTTAAPTTAAPTTNKATTAAPTTAAPTTAAPTTKKPTTAATTNPPTTAAPTTPTQIALTILPTTEIPTTMIATTMIPGPTNATTIQLAFNEEDVRMFKQYFREWIEYFDTWKKEFAKYTIQCQMI